MSVEVRYLDVTPGNRETPRVDGANISDFCDPALLFDGTGERNWASLESGGWPLDGSRCFLDVREPPAFLSDCTAGLSSGQLGGAALDQLQLANENYSFDMPFSLELTTSNLLSAPGLTFRFDRVNHAWCNAMLVQWCGNDGMLAEEMVFPEGPDFTLHRNVEGFNRLTLTFYSMNRAGAQLHLRQILLGREIVFSQEQLGRVELVNEADPSLSRLTADVMTVTVYGDQSQNLAPQQNQKMELYRDGKLLASHSIQSCSRQDHLYTFQCQSIIGRLGETFLGGIYQGEPVGDVLPQVLGDIPYELDPALQDALLTGYLPVCTQREALQQIAFSVGGVISTFGTSGICITAIPSLVTGSFNPENVFSGGNIKTVPQPTRVEVVAHTYKPAGQEETLLEQEDLGTQETLLTFPQPHWDYTATGATILEQNVNFVRLIPTGKVTLKAKNYLHSQMRCVRTAGGEGNQVQKIENATLVHTGNVHQIADRLLKLSKLEQTLQQDAVVEDQRVGQKTVMSTPWRENMYGYITAMQSAFSKNGHTASVTVLGTLQLPGEENLFAGEFYSGIWEVI